MCDTPEGIRARLARSQICLLQTQADQKFNLQLQTDNYLYGILDVFAEKSSSPQFVYQFDERLRPMTFMEYQLFIEKLKEDMDQSDDPSFRVFHIGDEIKRLNNEYKDAVKFNHICLRDLRTFSQTHNWTIDMYKEGKWHTARLGKIQDQDIFTVGQEPMSGKEFVGLIRLANDALNKKMWKEPLPTSFEDRFINTNCRLIKSQRKNKNQDRGHPPRE